MNPPLTFAWDSCNTRCMTNGTRYEIGNYIAKSLGRARAIQARVGGSIWVRRVDGFGRVCRMEVG